MLRGSFSLTQINRNYCRTSVNRHWIGLRTGLSLELTHSRTWCKVALALRGTSTGSRPPINVNTEHGGAHCFIVRARKGLIRYLAEELRRIPSISCAASVSCDAPTDEGLSTTGTATVQVLGPWRLIYMIVSQSRLAESVAVRVGPTFRCTRPEELAQGIQHAPWASYMRTTELALLPFDVAVEPSATQAAGRVVSSASLSSRRVSTIVAEALNGQAGDGRKVEGGVRDKWSAYARGLRVYIDEDICSLELACSGPLGVRPFVYTHAFRGKGTALHQPIPTPYRGTAIAGFNAGLTSAEWSVRPSYLRTQSGNPGLASSIQQLIAGEWHGTKDLAAPYAAAIVQFLPLRDLLSSPGGAVVWDPFCGNGSLLLEVLASCLGVGSASPTHPFPHSQLLAHRQSDAIENAFLGGPMHNLSRLTLVGSDASSAAILRARRLLTRFCEYHKEPLEQICRTVTYTEPSIPESDGKRTSKRPALLHGPGFLDGGVQPSSREAVTVARPRPRIEAFKMRHSRGAQAQDIAATDSDGFQARGDQLLLGPDGLRSFSAKTDVCGLELELPCDVSLNVAHFESIGPYLSGPFVVTRAPRDVGALGPSKRMADLHERFGHFLAGRSNWAGVYVFAEGPEFKRHSRLAWEVLFRFTDHSGRKCQLLRMIPGVRLPKVKDG